jgi:hypothetical protein
MGITPSEEEHIMADFKGFPREFITFYENLKKMFPKPLLDLYRRAVVDKKLGVELKKV